MGFEPVTLALLMQHAVQLLPGIRAESHVAQPDIGVFRGDQVGQLASWLHDWGRRHPRYAFRLGRVNELLQVVGEPVLAPPRGLGGHLQRDRIEPALVTRSVCPDESLDVVGGGSYVLPSLGSVGPVNGTATDQRKLGTWEHAG